MLKNQDLPFHHLPPRTGETSGEKLLKRAALACEALEVVGISPLEINVLEAKLWLVPAREGWVCWVTFSCQLGLA